jgi:shikimate kinase
LTRLKKHIVITGFMAAGKTTVGRALAEALGREFLDLDHLVHRMEGRTPQEIIDESGTERFRELETEALARALGVSSEDVIALGGGTWTIERNRDLIAKADAVSVWLDLPFPLCWQRIGQSSIDRPFARDHKKAEELYRSRKSDYSKAQLHVELSGEEPAGEVCERIIDMLNLSKR